MRRVGVVLLILFIGLPLVAVAYLILSGAATGLGETVYVAVAFLPTSLARYNRFVLAHGGLLESMKTHYQGLSWEHWMAVATNRHYRALTTASGGDAVFVRWASAILIALLALTPLMLALRVVKWVLEIDIFALLIGWLFNRQRPPAPLAPGAPPARAADHGVIVNVYNLSMGSGSDPRQIIGGLPRNATYLSPDVLPAAHAADETTDDTIDAPKH